MAKTQPSSAPESFVAALVDNPLLSGMPVDGRALLGAYLVRESYEVGSVVISEGAADRDMYFVLDGTVRIERGSLQLGTLSRGEQFGALGLVTGSPHSASIVADTELMVARLSSRSYEALAEEHPVLALRFTRALVAGLGARLNDVSDSVGELLHERSLPRRIKVKVRVGGRLVEARTGGRVGDLLPAVVQGRAVVAALVDRCQVSLVEPIDADCEVAPLTTSHWEGRRIYTHSVALLLIEAAYRIDPALELRMAHSVGVAQRVRVTGDLDRPALATKLELLMRELAAADAPLREEWWTVGEARAHFLDAGRHRAAELLDTWREPAVQLASYGQVYALRMAPLLPSTGAMTGFRVIPDQDGLLLVYGNEAQRSGDAPSGGVPDEAAVAEAIAAAQHARSMTHAHGRWLQELATTSVGEFNRTCVAGDVPRLIRVAEGFQEKRISAIADAILEAADHVKVVCVAGPSSSGKTTFIKRLQVQLQVNGIHPVGVSLDDYYVNREATPLDADGEYDFESFDALDSELMQDHFQRLLSGEDVRLARYDFQTGRSIRDGGREVRVGERDVLILEGIHGLNPKLLKGIAADKIFRVFICPLAQLPFDHLTRVHASDVRLLRRIVRDRRSRGHNAAASIQRWPSVRRGERNNIFPYQHHADAVFDSSLIYELSVLKVYAERYLLEVPREHSSYTTAFRLLQLVDRFITIYPDHVPATSILREFIGGSSFER